MRVSELAKALDLSSKELLVKLKALRITAKSAASVLDADAVNRARKALAKPKRSAAKAPAPKAPTATAARAKTAKAAAAALPAPHAKPSAPARATQPAALVHPAPAGSTSTACAPRMSSRFPVTGARSSSTPTPG